VSHIKNVINILLRASEQRRAPPLRHADVELPQHRLFRRLQQPNHHHIVQHPIHHTCEQSDNEKDRARENSIPTRRTMRFRWLKVGDERDAQHRRRRPPASIRLASIVVVYHRHPISSKFIEFTPAERESVCVGKVNDRYLERKQSARLIELFGLRRTQRASGSGQHRLVGRRRLLLLLLQANPIDFVITRHRHYYCQQYRFLCQLESDALN
jgi:hypothetical protein